jgi:hypothetical protein
VDREGTVLVLYIMDSAANPRFCHARLMWTGKAQCSFSTGKFQLPCCWDSRLCRG